MDSFEEKENRVLKLLEERKNYQKMPEEEHVSFTFISNVNKKMLGQDPSVNKKLSIPTQALKLFSEGKSVIEVTISLDRPIKEIQQYHNDYLKLKNRGYLVSLIEAHVEHLPIIIKLINYIIQNPFTRNDIVATLALVKEMPRPKSTKKNLEKKIEILINTRNRLLNRRESTNQINY